MHYLVFALTPTGSLQEVDDLMAPFDENREVAPHDENCSCIGWIANRESRDAINRDIAPLGKRRQEIRQESQALVEALSAQVKEEGRPDYLLRVPLSGIPDAIREAEGEFEGYKEIKRQAVELERESVRLSARIERVRQMRLATHPMFDRPDADCEDCQGGGAVSVTWNPDGHWDWWVTGGRWTGHLDPGYHPDDDPRNFQECRYCDENGKRYWVTDSSGQSRGVDPGTPGATAKVCNVCSGSKRERAFENAPHPEGDRMPAGQVADLLIDNKIDTPYTLLTEDGGWQTHGPQKTDWKEDVIKVLRENPDHYVTVVDCHS